MEQGCNAPESGELPSIWNSQGPDHDHHVHHATYCATDSTIIVPRVHHRHTAVAVRSLYNAGTYIRASQSTIPAFGIIAATGTIYSSTRHINYSVAPRTPVNPVYAKLFHIRHSIYLA